MQANKQLLLNLSLEDFKLLEDQANSHGLAKSEYIRTLIQTIHIANSVKEDEKGNITFSLGNYGFKLDKKYLEDFSMQMEGFFKGIEKRMQRVIISKPKGTKKVMYRQTNKSKKTA